MMVIVRAPTATYLDGICAGLRREKRLAKHIREAFSLLWQARIALDESIAHGCGTKRAQKLSKDIRAHMEATHDVLGTRIRRPARTKTLTRRRR